MREEKPVCTPSCGQNITSFFLPPELLADLNLAKVFSMQGPTSADRKK